MVSVRFNDPANLISCASFLEYAFPGTAKEDGLVLELDHDLSDAAERRLVDRLLWAWRIGHNIHPFDGFASSDAATVING